MAFHSIQNTLTELTKYSVLSCEGQDLIYISVLVLTNEDYQLDNAKNNDDNFQPVQSGFSHFKAALII